MVKKKILAISTFPAPYRVDLFQLLAEKYDVDLFFETGSDQNRKKEWFATTDTFPFTMLDCVEGWKKYQYTLKYIERYDVVFIYDYWTNTQMKLQLTCRVKHIPFVLNCDGALLDVFMKREIIKDGIKRFFIKHADGYMAGGENAKKYFMRYGADQHKITIHKFSSMHLEELEKIAAMCQNKAAIKKTLGLPDKKIVLGIGQYIERKGFDVLLRAWAGVHVKDAYLIIIGGGDLESQYQRIIIENRISNVKILGYKAPEDLKNYYSSSDIFVLPTREDIWGLVINEAMAYGLPVITTTCCGAGLELVEDQKNGKIVPVDNIKAMSEAMEMFLMYSDEKLRDIAKINQKKIAGYSLEYMAHMHEQVIECLGENNAYR